MTVLLEQLKRRSNLRFAIVGCAGLKDHHFEKDGVEYFIVKKSIRQIMWNRLGSYRGALPLRAQVREFASIVSAWNPDVVHVHGTEGSFGLIKAWGLTDKPVAVSVQGVVAACAPKAYGDLLPAQIHGRLRSVIGVGLENFRFWKVALEQTRHEEDIIRAADMVLGRTQFDHAWARAYRADVCYRHVDELMRPEFGLASSWSVEECNRHHIFCISGNRPLKGLHILIEAIYRLKATFPDIKLNVASAGFVPHPADDYARYVLRHIREKQLDQAVNFCGVLETEQLVQQLRLANCYVTPSFVENSSNALQEAMLVGAPIVATYSGGIPTIINSEESGLTFPTGDPAMLAWQISRIFRDDNLASRLGANARRVAMERQDPRRVEEQLLSAYRELAQTRKSESPGFIVEPQVMRVS